MVGSRREGHRSRIDEFDPPGQLVDRSMRQLINSTYLTLDGVVEGPHLWPSLKGGTSDEGEAIQTELLETCDLVLMGRRTYEVFAPAWSSRSGDRFSDRINSVRKLVVSTTLANPEWTNTEVIAGDVVGRVRGLKAEDGGHIVQYGFGDVSRLLLEQARRSDAPGGRRPMSWQLVRRHHSGATKSVAPYREVR